MLNLSDVPMHAVTIHVHPRALTDILRGRSSILQFAGFPADAAVFHAEASNHPATLAVTLHHPSFPRVAPGQPIPVVGGIVDHWLRDSPSRVLIHGVPLWDRQEQSAWNGPAAVAVDPGEPGGDRSAVAMDHPGPIPPGAYDPSGRFIPLGCVPCDPGEPGGDRSALAMDHPGPIPAIAQLAESLADHRRVTWKTGWIPIACNSCDSTHPMMMAVESNTIAEDVTSAIDRLDDLRGPPPTDPAEAAGSTWRDRPRLF